MWWDGHNATTTRQRERTQDLGSRARAVFSAVGETFTPIEKGPLGGWQSDNKNNQQTKTTTTKTYELAHLSRTPEAVRAVDGHGHNDSDEQKLREVNWSRTVFGDVKRHKTAFIVHEPPPPPFLVSSRAAPQISHDKQQQQEID